MEPRELLPLSASGLSFVAIGDSFTEGLNDLAPGGTAFRGWADRLAGMIAARYPGLRYANLAVRGKLFRQIVHEQVPAAMALLADREPGSAGLVSLAAGGNDILRPGGDPDTLAELFDAAVSRIRESGAEVLMFTGFDPLAFPVMRLLRGRIAAYNMHLRAIADTHGCYLVDLWSMRFLRDPRAWSPDRLHLTSDSHRWVALRACEILGVPVTEDWRTPPDADTPVPALPAANGNRAAWVTARRSDAQWAKEYFVPWINRRLRGTSSGDGVLAKRPTLLPVSPPP